MLAPRFKCDGTDVNTLTALLKNTVQSLFEDELEDDTKGTKNKVST